MTDNSENRCIRVPDDFPTPRFNFGDWVQTYEGDLGMIVGMILNNNGSARYWMYELDLTTDSPNFSIYQGCFFDDEDCEEVSNSPCCYSFNESVLNLQSEPLAGNA